MENQKIETMPAHWLLAKVGKKVLRPGGRELTEQMIANLNITSSDDIVEFAPGLGFSASIALKANPKSYKGVELNKQAANILKETIKGDNIDIIIGNASKSNLPDNASTIVYGEAMLTMQSKTQKSNIIKEAKRILKKGGLYGIHELGLKPDDINEEAKKQIKEELVKSLKVNARPLTQNEWKDILEKEGFKVIKILQNPMALLEPKRVIKDEGLFRSLKIIFNVISNSKIRKRILAIRKVFGKYKHNMQAVAIIAQKI